MRPLLRTALLFAALVLAGCLGSREASHPLIGDWSYRVETDDAVYEGVLSFTVEEGDLQGTIRGDDGGVAAPLEDLRYQSPELMFEFQSPEFGALEANLDVAGDAFSGELNVSSFGVSVPITGARIDSD